MPEAQGNKCFGKNIGILWNKGKVYFSLSLSFFWREELIWNKHFDGLGTFLWQAPYFRKAMRVKTLERK